MATRQATDPSPASAHRLPTTHPARQEDAHAGEVHPMLGHRLAEVEHHEHRRGDEQQAEPRDADRGEAIARSGTEHDHEQRNEPQEREPAARIPERGDRDDRMEDRLVHRQQEQRDVLPQHVGLDQGMGPVQRAAPPVLDGEEHPEPEQAGAHHHDHEGHVNPEQPPFPAPVVRAEYQPVVERRHHRQHERRLLRADGDEPRHEGRHEPPPPRPDDGRAVAEERGEREGRAQQVGARGHVADRLGHQRVHGQQRRRGEGHGQAPAVVHRALARLVVIVRGPAREREEQPDVQQVEQQVRDVVAERRQPPHGVVERVREVDERPLDVVEDDAVQIRQRRDRGVLDHDDVVVVHEGVRQRAPVGHDGQQEGHRAQARGQPAGGLERLVRHLYRLV